jgi:hypothetical protein
VVPANSLVCSDPSGLGKRRQLSWEWPGGGAGRGVRAAAIGVISLRRSHSAIARLPVPLCLQRGAGRRGRYVFRKRFRS